MRKSHILHTALVVAALAIGTAGCATTTYRKNPVQSLGVENRAYNNGYRDGESQGKDDRRHDRRPIPSLSNRYRDGDHDYDRRDGTREEYARVYRNAFSQGYEAGFTGGPPRRDSDDRR